MTVDIAEFCAESELKQAIYELKRKLYINACRRAGLLPYLKGPLWPETRWESEDAVEDWEVG